MWSTSQTCWPRCLLTGRTDNKPTNAIPPPSGATLCFSSTASWRGTKATWNCPLQNAGSLAAAGPILVPPQVRELAQSIVAGSKSDYERAARLERFLLENYDDLRAQPLPSSGDAVESLLFERTAGYCAQFATTMAVMARTVGLPARVATGYLPGSYDSLAGVHVVRLKDAHAWVEINFKRSGWVPFDPTPRPDSPFGFSKGSLQQTRSLQQIMRHGVRGALTDRRPHSMGSRPSLETIAPSRTMAVMATAGAHRLLPMAERRAGSVVATSRRSRRLG